MVSDERCSSMILSGVSYEECLRMSQLQEFSFNQSTKFKMASFPRTFTTGSQSHHGRSVSDVTQPSLARPQRDRCKSRSTPEANMDRLAVEVALALSSTKVADLPSRVVTPPRDKDPSTKLQYRENRRNNARSFVLSQTDGLQLPGLRHNRQRSSLSTQPGQLILRPIQIVRDGQGRRLDPPVDVPAASLEKVERLHLCNNYHLKNDCGKAKCKYLHLIPDRGTGSLRGLTPVEKEALRLIARRSFCRNDTSCNDPHCYAGHRCVNHIKWKQGCSFPISMHFEV